MTKYQPTEVREAFHCLLLAHLPAAYRTGTNGQPAPLRLKGGVNLRLFHGSVRFSEDVDFDIPRERGRAFLAHLTKTLKDPAFLRALLPFGIRNVTLSELDGGQLNSSGFKQKVQLDVGGVPLPTKVEASYREETRPDEAEDREIGGIFLPQYLSDPKARYIRPVIVAAYPAPVAIWQKALALSRRDPPQTRDAYDLDFLLRTVPPHDRAAGEQLVRERMTAEQLDSAAGFAEVFTKNMFEAQVVEYLPDDKRAEAVAAWADAQHHVWEWVATIRSTTGAAPAPAPPQSP
jgi:hypothetical protein